MNKVILQTEHDLNNSTDAGLVEIYNTIPNKKLEVFEGGLGVSRGIYTIVLNGELIRDKAYKYNEEGLRDALIRLIMQEGQEKREVKNE